VKNVDPSLPLASPRGATFFLSDAAHGSLSPQHRGAKRPRHHDIHSLNHNASLGKETRRQQPNPANRQGGTGRGGFTQNKAQNDNFREAQERGACEACSIRKKPVSKTRQSPWSTADRKNSAGSSVARQVQVRALSALAFTVSECVGNSEQGLSVFLGRKKNSRE
jgi:hypothetical protein